MLVRTILVRVTVFFASQADQGSVLFHDPNATGHPRGAQFFFSVRKGAVCILAHAMGVMPTNARLPVKAFRLVMALLSAAKTGDLQPRRRRVGHVRADVVRRRHYINVFTNRQHLQERNKKKCFDHRKADAWGSARCC